MLCAAEQRRIRFAAELRNCELVLLVLLVALLLLLVHVLVCCWCVGVAAAMRLLCWRAVAMLLLLDVGVAAGMLLC